MNKKLRYIAGENLVSDEEETIIRKFWEDAFAKIDLKEKIYDTLKNELLRTETEGPYAFDNVNRL
jgi:hypothetical protein